MHMIAIFHDDLDNEAHSSFQTWRRNNPDGFFINCKGMSSWMVHRSDCTHFGNMEWDRRDFEKSLTKLRKACSADYQALIKWVKQDGQADVTPCNDCSPGENSSEGSEWLTAAARQLRDEGAFDPNGITDARERVLSSIVRRQGQPAFRQRLLAAYDGRCAVSECEVEAVLDAAHIVPYHGSETNHISNGLLLRTDIHTLFDLELVAVDYVTMRVLIAPALSGTCYEEFRGRQLRLPDDPRVHPNKQALEQHLHKSGLLNRRT
jgi:hypothetical protein